MAIPLLQSGQQAGLLGSLLGFQSAQQSQNRISGDPFSSPSLGQGFGSFRDHRESFEDMYTTKKKLSFLPALRQEIDNWIKI